MTEQQATRTRTNLEGLLFFPLTAFGADGSLDIPSLRAHVRNGVDAGAGAVFVACGTGEFFSLDLDEYREAVAATVEEVAGAVPVFSGVGYGTALALKFLAVADECGVDGVLVMPNYLIRGTQDGLFTHYDTIARATDLDVIVYQRANAILEPTTVVRLLERENIVGFKDGIGDLDLLQRIISAVRTEGSRQNLQYFNGLPTAELTGLAFRGLGVLSYSSAVFAFAPDLALGFHAAFNNGDDETVNLLLDNFFRPYVELRNRGVGYPVSLVKEGANVLGQQVGPVRAPLSAPAAADVDELVRLVAVGRKVLESR